MDCKNFDEVSQLYIDEGLDTERVAQFEAHLRACEGCKRELEYLQVTIRGIESYPQLEARLDLADNIMTRIEGTASPWDFSQELGFITGVLRELSSGQLTRFPKAFAAMIVGLILLPPRIYLHVFYNCIPANPCCADANVGKSEFSRKSSNQSTDYKQSEALHTVH